MTFKEVVQFVLFGLALLALTFFIGRWTKPCPLPTVSVKDSVNIISDTIRFIDTTFVEVEWQNIPEIIDTSQEDFIHTSEFDTTLISKKDTFKISNKVAYNSNEKTFNFSQNLEHKDFVEIIIDTVKIYTEKLIEIPVPEDSPFYDSFEFGFGIGTLISLVAIIFFGG